MSVYARASTSFNLGLEVALVIFEGQKKKSRDEFEESEKDVGQTEVAEQVVMCACFPLMTSPR